MSTQDVAGDTLRRVTRRVSRDHITHVFDKDLPPVADIAPGEHVLFETLDAVCNKVKTMQDALSIALPHDQANPATGPVRVLGAEAGDTLAVTIVDIRPGPVGLGRIKKGGGILTSELNPPAANLTPVHDGVITFNSRLRFRAKPMVGVIGTAPADKPVITFYPGPHGGNLDINELGIGATIYLPVYVPGALLSLGDVHVRMGDGELTGGGLDIDAEVTIVTRVVKRVHWRRPIIETHDAWSACAHAPSLAEAIKIATRDMTEILALKLNMSREEAFILIGAAGDARIGQAAGLDLDSTAYLRMSKEILPHVF